jgi:hypothetical protein
MDQLRILPLSLAVVAAAGIGCALEGECGSCIDRLRVTAELWEYPPVGLQLFLNDAPKQSYDQAICNDLPLRLSGSFQGETPGVVHVELLFGDQAVFEQTIGPIYEPVADECSGEMTCWRAEETIVVPVLFGDTEGC